PADTAEHTLLQCSHFSEQRKRLKSALRVEDLAAKRVVRQMLEFKAKWELIRGFIERVLREKEAQERVEERRPRYANRPSTS
ncbi:hypothetical protein BIW11_02608, partial [Tropilaelaps mercedesae]